MPWDGGTNFVPGTKAFASLFNDRFAEVAAYTDGIPVPDLANGSAGQLIVCDGGGEPHLRTLSGEATISAGGALTLVPKTRFHQQTANKDLFVAGAIPGMQTAALEAGAWFCWVKLEVEDLGSAGAPGSQFQLEKSAVTNIGTFKIFVPSGGAPGRVGNGATMALLTSGGSDYARVTFTGGGSSGTAVAVRGVLVAMKVA